MQAAKAEYHNQAGGSSRTFSKCHFKQGGFILLLTTTDSDGRRKRQCAQRVTEEGLPSESVTLTLEVKRTNAT